MALVCDGIGPPNVLTGAKVLEVLQAASASDAAGSAVPAGLTGVRIGIAPTLAGGLLLQPGVDDSEDGSRDAVRNRLNLTARTGWR